MADHIATKSSLPSQHLNGKTPMHADLHHIPSQPHLHYWWPHSGDPLSPHTHLKQLPTKPPDLSTRKKGIYQSLWETKSHQLVPNCRQYIFKSNIPPASRGVILRYWNGCLYNQKIAFRLKHSANDRCPMCRAPDSGTHMLGACTHPHITKLRIQRHNDVVRVVGRLIRSSLNLNLRNSHIIMDAGKAPDAIIGAEGHRIPNWLIPDTAKLKVDREKLRPDILCLTLPHDTPLEQIKQDLYSGKLTWKDFQEKSVIYILEISLCGDLRYDEHFLQKSEQHQQLKQALTDQGWPDIRLLPPLLFGIGGSLYTQTKTMVSNTLRIPQHLITPAFEKIQRIAAQRACEIVRARREHDKPYGLGPLPPALKRTTDYRG